MANFRIINGMWIEIMEDIGDLKKNEILQILHTPRTDALCFIGKKGIYPSNGPYKPVKELNTIFQYDRKSETGQQLKKIKGWFF